MQLLPNPRLDELALAVRWLKLSDYFSAGAPTLAAGGPLWPVLVDTTYVEPFACLLACVPSCNPRRQASLNAYDTTSPSWAAPGLGSDGSAQRVSSSMGGM